MADEYRVKNWSEYQHYKDRDPPWIKLHFKMLTSRDWVVLNDSSRVLAIASMLIASRHGGKIPNDPEYIQRIAFLNKPPDFKPLVKCGFLERDGEEEEEKRDRDRDRDRDRAASKMLASMDLPFKSSDFRDLWVEWVKHRSEIRKPLKPTQATKQLKAMSKIGELRATAMIEYTISMGWQGLREPEKTPEVKPDPDFDLFWQVWPEAKRKSELEARRLFTSAVNKPPIKELIAEIELQKKSEEWTKEGGRYIPSPVNWLKDGRWTDIVTVNRR